MALKRNKKIERRATKRTDVIVYQRLLETGFVEDVKQHRPQEEILQTLGTCNSYFFFPEFIPILCLSSLRQSLMTRL